MTRVQYPKHPIRSGVLHKHLNFIDEYNNKLNGLFASCKSHVGSHQMNDNHCESHFDDVIVKLTTL